ncbi:transposase, partial [Streptomyces celluloflavus]|uniref:transposase n=1 Tax=Streptomyces celluloflavus TaxID=58344 RepID=UPI00369F2605
RPPPPHDRMLRNGTGWRSRTGTARRDVPEPYGPRATLRTRFRRWVKGGTFARPRDLSGASAVPVAYAGLITHRSRPVPRHALSPRRRAPRRKRGRTAAAAGGRRRSTGRR